MQRPAYSAPCIAYRGNLWSYWYHFIALLGWVVFTYFDIIWTVTWTATRNHRTHMEMIALKACWCVQARLVAFRLGVKHVMAPDFAKAARDGNLGPSGASRRMECGVDKRHSRYFSMHMSSWTVSANDRWGEGPHRQFGTFEYICAGLPWMCFLTAQHYGWTVGAVYLRNFNRTMCRSPGRVDSHEDRRIFSNASRTRKLTKLSHLLAPCGKILGITYAHHLYIPSFWSSVWAGMDASSHRSA